MVLSLIVQKLQNSQAFLPQKFFAMCTRVAHKPLIFEDKRCVLVIVNTKQPFQDLCRIHDLVVHDTALLIVSSLRIQFYFISSHIYSNLAFYDKHNNAI